MPDHVHIGSHLAYLFLNYLLNGFGLLVRHDVVTLHTSSRQLNMLAGQYNIDWEIFSMELMCVPMHLTFLSLFTVGWMGYRQVCKPVMF